MPSDPLQPHPGSSGKRFGERLRARFQRYERNRPPAAPDDADLWRVMDAGFDPTVDDDEMTPQEDQVRGRDDDEPLPDDAATERGDAEPTD